MKLIDQPATPSLARRLGDVPHISPLLRRVRQLSGSSNNHLADAASRTAPELEPWLSLSKILPRRHRVRLDALPHWSRFVLQTGYTSAGRGQHIQWLMCDE